MNNNLVFYKSTALVENYFIKVYGAANAANVFILLPSFPV